MAYHSGLLAILWLIVKSHSNHLMDYRNSLIPIVIWLVLITFWLINGPIAKVKKKSVKLAKTVQQILPLFPPTCIKGRLSSWNDRDKPYDKALNDKP